MPHDDSNDLVDQWASLMDEWTMVSDELDATMALAQSVEPAAKLQWQQRLDEVRQRQASIKQRIDDCISGATAVRTSPVDALIIGQIFSTSSPSTVEIFHQQLKNGS